MGGDSGFDPTKSSFWTRGGLLGAVTGRSWTGQSKAAKDAENAAIDRQNALLKEAKDKTASEDSTAKSAISRARQKALAAATAATGRAATIKTGSIGDVGTVSGQAKSLIGE